jgi:hypothetical protein
MYSPSDRTALIIATRATWRDVLAALIAHQPNADVIARIQGQHQDPTERYQGETTEIVALRLSDWQPLYEAIIAAAEEDLEDREFYLTLLCGLSEQFGMLAQSFAPAASVPTYTTSPTTTLRHESAQQITVIYNGMRGSIIVAPDKQVQTLVVDEVLRGRAYIKVIFTDGAERTALVGKAPKQQAQGGRGKRAQAAWRRSWHGEYQDVVMELA